MYDLLLGSYFGISTGSFPEAPKVPKITSTPPVKFGLNAAVAPTVPPPKDSVISRPNPFVPNTATTASAFVNA